MTGAEYHGIPASEVRALHDSYKRDLATFRKHTTPLEAGEIFGDGVHFIRNCGCRSSLMVRMDLRASS